MQEPGSGAPVRLDDAASQAPAVRASDRERDAATQRLQEAFAEGSLDDEEFDQRMRTALSARTRPELDEPLAGPAAARPAHCGARDGGPAAGAAGGRVQGLDQAAAAGGGYPSTIRRWCTRATADWTCGRPSSPRR